MEDLLKKENPTFDTNEDDQLNSMCEEIKIDPSLLIASINRIKVAMATLMNIHGQGAQNPSKISKEDVEKMISFIETCCSKMMVLFFY